MNLILAPWQYSGWKWSKYKIHKFKVTVEIMKDANK